ncbi:MAG: acyl-CoA desaturase [Propionibacteriaceae bacterium]|nr:acyl-CoA desaturase [Propionibacteriaceae bacterium]
MSRTHKLINLAGIVLPFIGLIVAIVLLWDRMVGLTELSILAVGYVLTGVGITVGYHRLFTHRSFQTYRPVRYAFAVLGQMAVEGDVLAWVSDHRKHHQFSDQAGDPHSPHAGFGGGVLGALQGLWHAHTGWLFSESGRADQARYAKDLMRDTGLRVIAKLFLPLVLFSLLVPALVGWVLIGGWYGFLAGLFWGGAVRIFLLHHVTFSINSICHFWGRRRFASRDESRNVWWLSWISFGESWHNNHHAFPTSAFHGLRRLEVDPGGWVIWTLEKLGLAWDVVRIPADKQVGKLAAR